MNNKMKLFILLFIIIVCSIFLYFIKYEFFRVGNLSISRKNLKNKKYVRIRVGGANKRGKKAESDAGSRRTSIDPFINDYYDKYEGDLSINPIFYNESLTLPETHYLFEMNDRFFIDILNGAKIKSDLYPIKKMGNILPTNEKEQLLKKIDAYLLNLLNSKLSSTEKFIYNLINSNIQEAIEYNKKIIAITNHIVYRDTKAYGESITLTTLYDNNKIMGLLNYKFNGLIFEDKIRSYQPSNLESDKFQDYKKDNLIIYDEHYEKTYLCRLYNDIYKYRGIKVANNLNC